MVASRTTTPRRINEPNQNQSSPEEMLRKTERELKRMRVKLAKMAAAMLLEYATRAEQGATAHGDERIEDMLFQIADLLEGGDGGAATQARARAVSEQIEGAEESRTKEDAPETCGGDAHAPAPRPRKQTRVGSGGSRRRPAAEKDVSDDDCDDEMVYTQRAKMLSPGEIMSVTNTMSGDAKSYNLMVDLRDSLAMLSTSHARMIEADEEDYRDMMKNSRRAREYDASIWRSCSAAIGVSDEADEFKAEERELARTDPKEARLGVMKLKRMFEYVSLKNNREQREFIEMVEAKEYLDTHMTKIQAMKAISEMRDDMAMLPEYYKAGRMHFELRMLIGKVPPEIKHDATRSWAEALADALEESVVRELPPPWSFKDLKRIIARRIESGRDAFIALSAGGQEGDEQSGSEAATHDTYGDGEDEDESGSEATHDSYGNGEEGEASERDDESEEEESESEGEQTPTASIRYLRTIMYDKSKETGMQGFESPEMPSPEMIKIDVYYNGETVQGGSEQGGPTAIETPKYKNHKGIEATAGMTARRLFVSDLEGPTASA